MAFHAIETIVHFETVDDLKKAAARFMQTKDDAVRVAYDAQYQNDETSGPWKAIASRSQGAGYQNEIDAISFGEWIMALIATLANAGDKRIEAAHVRFIMTREYE